MAYWRSSIVSHGKNPAAISRCRIVADRARSNDQGAGGTPNAAAIAASIIADRRISESYY
jgi:hypothetical protein